MTSDEYLSDVEPTTGSAPYPDGPAGAGGEPTSVIVGIAALVWDRLAPRLPGRRPDWREVTVGAVFEARDAVFEAQDTAAEVLGRTQRLAGQVRERPARWVNDVAQQARHHVARLAQRGAAEQDRGRQRILDAAGALVDAVATATPVNRAVDAQLDRVLRPLVVVVLDDVLVRLEAEPERIQPLIRGQRESMVDELVERIRGSARAGDATIDRFAARMRRGKRQPAAAPVTAPPAPPGTMPATVPSTVPTTAPAPISDST